LGDRLGFHFLPKHYYTPVPDYAWLRANRALWDKRADLYSLEWDLDSQLTWLTEICKNYRSEVTGLSSYRQLTQYGPGYGEVESQVLHCFCRAMQPQKIIEVGSGVSTACMANACPSTTEITCIEPYPRDALRNFSRISLIEEMVQAVNSSVFQ